MAYFSNVNGATRPVSTDYLVVIVDGSAKKTLQATSDQHPSVWETYQRSTENSYTPYYITLYIQSIS